VRAANAEPSGWLEQLPLTELAHMPRPYFDFFYRWLEHPDVDGFWAQLDVGRRFADIEVPALHLVGLFDKFRYGSTRNYRGLRDHAGSATARASQRLVIGPWTHGIPVEAKGSDYVFPAESDVDVRALVLRWYDHWLRGNDTGLLDEPAVRVWVQGADRWREAADWPLPETQLTDYWIHSGGAANGSDGDGRLSTEAPGDEPADRYRSDPADAVPTVIGAQTRSEGPIDVQEIERRADLLVYTSEPLADDLEVIGEITVELWAATSARDADWVVTLADVAPDGTSRRVTEGMLRARYRDGHERPIAVEPGAVIAYEIALRPTANRFLAGHRLRVDVASTSFAQYERNLGRGIPFDAELDGSAAEQTVYHDAARPSRIVLPVVPVRASEAGA
jgi:putative CocE/NonD family hydrolase